MKAYKLILLGLTLFVHSSLNAESITTLLRNNAKSVELNSSLGYGASYRIPESINSVRVDNGTLIVNYTMTDQSNTYTHNIQIDLSTCIISKGKFVGNQWSNNTYSYQVIFDSSSKNMVRDITYRSKYNRNDRESRDKEIEQYFSILCQSEYLMNQIYEAAYNLTKVFMPSYPTTDTGIEECFNKIQSLFKDYTVKSSDVRYASSGMGSDYKTTGITLQVKNNNLIIKYKDSGTEYRGTSNFYSGNKECIIPLSDAEFGYYGDGGISINSKQGIKLTDKNGTTIVNGTSFYTNATTCKEIVTNLIVLQELIKTTSFTKTLGVPKSNPTSQAKPTENKTISNKFEL